MTYVIASAVSIVARKVCVDCLWPACAGLTQEEKEEKARAKEALNSDGEGSDDEGDYRKAATYGTKKTEVRSCSTPEKSALSSCDSSDSISSQHMACYTCAVLPAVFLQAAFRHCQHITTWKDVSRRGHNVLLCS